MNLKKLNIIKRSKNRAEYSKLILLDYLDRYPASGEVFQPSYFSEELRISDFRMLMNVLMKQDYLEKNDEGVYVLTAKGKSHLKSKEDIVAFFRYATPYAQLSDYRKAKNGMKKNNFSFEGAMIKVFLKKIKYYQRRNDYDSVKDLHLEIAELYEKLGHAPQAMHHFLIALYIDTSGLEYYDALLDYMNDKCNEMKLRILYDYIYFSPRAIKGISRLKEHYKDEIVDSIYEKVKLSVILCSKENFKKLVKSMMDGTFNNYEWQLYLWLCFKEMIGIVSAQKSKASVE